MIERAYPQVDAEAVPVQLAFDSGKQSPQAGSPIEKHKANIGIPLIVSGLTHGLMVSVDGTMLTIEAPGGQRWSSGWRAGGPHLLPIYQHTRTDFTIDKDFFERVKTTPVRLHISFALAEFREKEVQRIVATAGEFAVPGGGRCSFKNFTGQMVCLFPLKRPFLLMSAKSEEITCAPREKETPLRPGITGLGLIWSRDSGPAELGLSPVHVSPLVIWGWGELYDYGTHQGVCPGTPLSFGILEEMRGMRTELQIDNIRLADYELKNSWPVGIGEVTVGIEH